MFERDWKVVVSLLLLTVLFFWQVVTNPGKIIYASHFSDVISHHSSYKFFISKTWQQLGRFPLWNPHVYMGTPFVSNPQSALFHPFTLLHMAFPTDSMFGYIFLIDIFLIGVFTYMFAKEIGITNYSSFVAAIVFMFSAYVVVHTHAGHTSHLDVLALIPLEFFLLERLIKKKDVFYGLVLPIPFALQILAGHMQMVVYVFGSLALYFVLRMHFVFRSGRKWKPVTKLAIILFLSFVVGFLMSSIQLIPMFGLLNDVVRTEGDAPTSYSLPPWQLPSVLMPELFGTFLDDTYWGGRNFWELPLYIGVFPLVLAVVAVFSNDNRFNKKYKTIFLALAALSILYAFGSYFPIFSFVYYLPFFNMLRKPSIILFLSSFALSILSGFGIDSVLEKLKGKKRNMRMETINTLIKILSLGTVLTILAIIIILSQKSQVLSIAEDMLVNRYESFTSDIHQLKYNIEYYRERIPGAYNHIVKSLSLFTILTFSSTLLLYAYANNIVSIRRFKILVLVVIVLDLWLFGFKYIKVEDPADMFPPETDRCMYEEWRTDDVGAYRVFDTLDLNSLAGSSDCFSQYLTMRQGVDTIWGDDSTVLQTYREFTDSTLNLFNGSASSDVKLNPKVLGMMNVKYVITQDPVSVDGLVLKRIQPTYEYVGYLQTDETKEVFVYENMEYLPRVFVVHNANIIEEDQETVSEILSTGFDPREYVIFHEDIGVELENPGIFETANMVVVSPNEILIDVEVSSPGFLVISQNWYPGWKAYDNSELKEVRRANNIFTAIPIDGGKHTIRLVYYPTSLRVGASITLVTTILLAVEIIYQIYSGKRQVVKIPSKGSKKRKPKICLACSAGGHLTEIKKIEKCYSKYPHFFLTFKRIDTEDLVDTERVYFIQDPANNPIKLLKNLIQSIVVLRKERPDIIITTGAGVAIPACYLGNLFFGTKVVYLESFARIREPSLTGRMLYPISDVFLVQWPELLEYYGDKAKFWGAII